MKIEKRGKYPGIKVHLEPEECAPFIELAKDAKKAGNGLSATPIKSSSTYFSLALKLGQKIEKLNQEDPGIFKERSPEEVRAELEEEARAALEKINAMDSGGDWASTKVKREVVPFSKVQPKQLFTRFPDDGKVWEVSNLAIKNAIVVKGFAHEVGLTDLIPLDEKVMLIGGGV